MKILLVTHGFPPVESGGVELHVKALAVGLLEAGHDVRVFTGSREGVVTGHALVDGVGVLRCARTPVKDPRTVVTDALVERTFEDAVSAWRPDIVHIHHLLFLSLGIPRMLVEMGIPFIVTVHDLWLLSPDFQPRIPLVNSTLRRSLRTAVQLRRRRVLPTSPVAMRIRATLAERVLRAADAVIAPSRFVENLLVTLGISGQRIVRIPHGVPRPASDLGRQCVTTADQLRVLFVSNIVPNKGLHVALRELALVPGTVRAGIRLHVWGADGDPKYARLMRRRAEGYDVRFHGSFSPSDLDEVFDSGDVLVLPALWHETFSFVVHEAAVRGVPAIVSNRGALPEVVHDASAVFDPTRRGDLARLLRDLAEGRPTLLGQWRANLPSPLAPPEQLNQTFSLYGRVAARR
jgi:glycosyltransferase involved in cell wall biosynthesis